MAIGNLPAEPRAVLEWFSRQVDRDEVEDPPFDETFLEGWSVVAAGGAVVETSVPAVDFESGTVEWR